MKSRRGLLGSIAVFGIGSGALWMMQGGKVGDVDVEDVEVPDVGDVTAPPSTENKLSETGSLHAVR